MVCSIRRRKTAAVIVLGVICGLLNGAARARADLPATLAAPQVPAPSTASSPFAAQSPRIGEAAMAWDDGWNVDDRGPCANLPKWEFLPIAPLLWQPPYAGLRQPRMFVIPNDLSNQFTKDTIDTAIGATVGLFRYRPAWSGGTEFELDFFGVHQSRWSERHLSVAADYRYGFPITFRNGPWQGKIGYEHTSTHLGDDFIKTFNRFKVPYVRDEIVLGLAYRWWNTLRLYGELGLAPYMSSPNEKGPERFAWGVEWSRQEPTGWKGQPFAAFDMDLRPEQDYRPNLSLQVGWQWIPENQRVSGRLALQYYNGYSPYGQFLFDSERWYGLGLFVDF
jgi:hypothetical protein